MWVGWRRGVGKGSWLGNATELEVMKSQHGIHDLLL